MFDHAHEQESPSDRFERFHRRGEDEEGLSPFDRYQAVFGEPLDIETMRGIRETEDHLIELGRMNEDERCPVPDHLAEDWAAAETSVD